MSLTTTPSPVQLVRFLERVRKKNPEATKIAIRFEGSWTGKPILQVGKEEFRVASCRSVLEAREVLAESSDDETVVLLTDRDERDLGKDLLARVAKRRIFTVDPWLVLQDLFGAHSLEPRLTRETWLAGELLAKAPAEGYPFVATGFLDFDTAWDAFAKAVLRLPGGRSDLRDLLSWASDPGRTVSWREGSPAFRKAVETRLSASAGTAASFVLRALEAGQAEPLALGLVSAVLRHPEAARSSETRAALVRLEPYFGGHMKPDGIPPQLGEESEALVRDTFRRGGFAAVQGVLARADALLATVRGDGTAYLSDLLPSGFDQRLRRFGLLLKEVLKGKGDLADLALLAAKVPSHLFAQRFPERTEAVRMAVRLARWLSPDSPSFVKRGLGGVRAHTEAAGSDQAPAMAPSFSDLALNYVSSGSWVDWARERLGVAESTRELAAAYRDLLKAVAVRREQENERFGRALAVWGGQSPSSAGLFGVERVLGDVLGPLAAKSPIFLVVLDGMSYAVYRQLLADMAERHGWFELGPQHPGRRLNAVAALPSITLVSRASLLTGSLRSGTSNEEKNGFAAQPGLLAACRPGRPPVLFHKGDVGDGRSGLAEPVAEKIGNKDWRVVGVVLNAVDDHLDRGDQIRASWTLGYIPLFSNLLDAAEAADRLVVVTADHGHIVEEGTEFRTFVDASERCRPVALPPGNGEFLASGPRVVAPANKVIVPWSEKLRYSGKKNGYHGGATPQEIVVPLAVLTRHEPLPDGWIPLPADTPDWWDPSEVRPAVVVPVRPGATQLSLFAPQEQGQRSVVAALLASSRFKENLEGVKRQNFTGEMAGKVLTALESRGGKMTVQALARELRIAEMRLPGFVTVLGRTLNVDGYQVLTIDEAGTVILSLDLLAAQFGL